MSTIRVRGKVSEPSHSARFGEIKVGEFLMDEEAAKGAAAVGLVDIVPPPRPDAVKATPKAVWKVTPPKEEAKPAEGTKTR